MNQTRALRLLVLLLPALAHGFDPLDQADAAGALQMTIPLSTRSLGMGGVTLGGSDVLRSWSNPALLAGLASEGEVAIQGGAQFINQTAFGLGGAWRLDPRWVLGATFGGYAMSFDEVDALGVAGDTISAAELGFGVSGAFQVNGWLATGLTLRALRESLLNSGSTAPAADLGATGTWGPFGTTLAVRNVGTALAKAEAETASTSASAAETTPGEFRIGAAYDFAAWHLKTAAEFGGMFAPNGTGGQIALGAEWWPAPRLALRAGGGIYGGATGGSFGLTGLWRQMGLDYAFTYMGAGAAHRVALSYAFGEPGAVRETAVVSEPEPAKRKEEPVPVAPKPGAARLNVAIADLRAENVSAGDAAVMADLLRNELVKTGTFNVIEKQNMDKVLAEHAFQQTGCTNEECAVKLGKLLNVQRMAVGSFGKLLDSYFLNIRVVNIETGQVNFADSAEGATVKDLKTAVRDMARRMASQIK